MTDTTKTNCKRATIYMPCGVHEQVRTLAYVRNTSQQALFREALDLLFKKEELEPWDTLKDQEDTCKS